MIADEVGISSCSPKSCCQRWKSKHQPNLITEPFCDLEDAIIIAALQVGLWELPSSKLHTSMVQDVPRWKPKHQPSLVTEPFWDLEDANIIVLCR